MALKSTETGLSFRDWPLFSQEQVRVQYLVELTALMSHYTQTAFLLNTSKVELPADHI